MFLKPAGFQNFLSKSNHIDEIYSALHDDDLGNVVTSALEVLKKTHQLPCLMKQCKDKKSSAEVRKKGNIAFKNGKFDVAYLCYNGALLLAPKDSKELQLAFSNRSAVFQEKEAYKACIKDIDLCFSMDCPSDIVDKLKKRRKEVEHLAAKQEESTCFITAISTSHTKHAFNNPDISCASSEIKATSSDIPTIVASNDIKIGSVLTTETAYVSYTDNEYSLLNCHYCQKRSLNLIPCEDCVWALFCDYECRNKCIKEYHKYECQILHVIREICHGPLPHLMVKAALKLRQNCKTWRELIQASYNMGLDRMISNSIKDVFDVESLFSILSQKDDKPFFYGVKYDASFVCAALLHYLNEIPSFFPKDIDEKKQAIHAFGRIMMFLSLHIVATKIYQPKCTRTSEYKYRDKPNHGYFSLIGKLNNSCTPNTVALYNDNKISLIALQSIKSGEEITISFQ